VVDHLRRKGRKVIVETDPIIDDVAIQPFDCQGQEDFADWKTIALVKRYIDSLPIDLRRVHEALYVQGLSQRDAAAVLGVGRQVVRTLECRLQKGLRTALKEIGYLDAKAVSPLALSHRQGTKAGSST